MRVSFSLAAVPLVLLSPGGPIASASPLGFFGSHDEDPRLDVDDGVRWIHTDVDQMWRPTEVALGDDEACAFAGMFLNNDRLTMFSTGSPEPVFDRLDLGPRNGRKSPSHHENKAS